MIVGKADRDLIEAYVTVDILLAEQEKNRANLIKAINMIGFCHEDVSTDLLWGSLFYLLENIA